MELGRTAKHFFAALFCIAHAAPTLADSDRVFAGGFDVAQLLINEVNPNISGTVIWWSC